MNGFPALVLELFRLVTLCLLGVGALTLLRMWQRPGAPVEIADSDFQPGQEWAYHTRPGEESSTLTVLRVERAPKLGVIVHVSVDGVQIGNPAQPMRRLGHLPMSEDAVRRSVTRKLRDDAPLRDVEDGYEIWREAYDDGGGGVFAIPVAEVVAHIAETLPR